MCKIYGSDIWKSVVSNEVNIVFFKEVYCNNLWCILNYFVYLFVVFKEKFLEFVYLNYLYKILGII